MSEDLLLCYNKGCGKKYKEEDNHDSACVHHPGVPVFHDALKGWSCCKKRSTDFTDFLHIPGCTTGAHNPVKPPEPEKTKEKPLAIGEEIVVRTPQPKVTKRPPDDLPYAPLQVKVANSLKTLLARMKREEEEKEQVDGDASKEREEEKDGSEEVKIGTTCTNKGCTITYLGPETNLMQCRYHSGAPIFHEGYKFWTCCQKRTSDFNEFLKQEGCTTGDHVWTETEKKIALCRYDWHQTGSFVIISIYAKACVPEHCSFEVNLTNVRISICFDNGKNEYQLELKLHGGIEPDRSSVELLGAKVEVKLRKADPFSWAALEHLEK